MLEQNGKSGKEAIVIGASIGGLLAARVLADHFEQVTLLERDTFPPPGANRKGVPQGKHTHALLTLGHEIMERYLPGLTNELAQLGAIITDDLSLTVGWFNRGGYHQPGISGLSGVSVSRPTLEASIRARVLALPNVRVLEDCDVLGLVATADQGRVIGVRLIRHRDRGTEEVMLADLVVDASGSGSRSPIWLEQLGYKRPDVEEVRIGMGYATCYYRRLPDQLPGLYGIVLTASSPNKRGGVLAAQEGRRWVVSLGGFLGDHAPTDYQGFLDYAKSLPTPDIYNVIKDVEPLGEPVAYKFPANLRRHYEKLSRFPEGYLVFGDALCSFNPTYGQGMTVAAMEAIALGESLANDPSQRAKEFFARASKIIDLPWSTAVGNDLSFPEVKGERPPMVRFINWYIGKLHIAAHQDSQVSIAFLKVINMIVPPFSVLHPQIVLRVIRANLWRRRRKIGAIEERGFPQGESTALFQ